MIDSPSTITELQNIAEQILPEEQMQFVRRGSYGNWTRDRNRTCLDKIALNPRLLRDTTERDLSTNVLGEKISLPVMCAPAGGQCGSHPDGELATARAAGYSSTLMALPVGSGYTIEEVAKTATSPIWFQHIHYSDAISEIFLPRLKPAGYSAVMLTVDAIGPFPPIRRPFNLDNAAPKRTRYPLQMKMFGSLAGYEDHDNLFDEHGEVRWVPPNITWDRLDWLKNLSGDLPLVIKGIRNVSDALLCVDHGVDGIVVSNHGGRQFDGGRSSIEILPEIADSVGDALEVYFDSGIRSGLDVFRAIALGAKAVFIGRPIHWGLAYGGEYGVSLAIEIIRAEFDKVLAFSGCNTVTEIDKHCVVIVD